MSSTRREHWQAVYTTKPVDRVSWYQDSPLASLSALDRLGAEPDQSLIDIGAGASALTAELAARGWRDCAALDISEAALAKAKEAAGDAPIDWIIGDITQRQPSRSYDVWHDRAVFHFLTDPADRRKYKNALNKGLSKDGLVLLATFALDGPEKCSDLPVQRYDAPSLAKELGAGWTLVEHWRETHVTPWGSDQPFTWCAFRRAGD